MNKQTEAMKLALEALECDPLDMALNPDGHMGFRKDQAITAIREALAEQPVVGNCPENLANPAGTRMDAGFPGGGEQPAHPDCDCGRELHEMHRPGCAYAKSKVEAATRNQQARYRAHIEDEWRKLNAEQPAPVQQEPVAWPHKWGCRANAFGECNMGCTSPASKPLTHERVKELLSEAGYDSANVQARTDFINGIRHAEAAHGVKE